MNDGAIAAVRAAILADPGNGPLRLALAELLKAAGKQGEAVVEAATVLKSDPGNAQALAIVTSAVADLGAKPGGGRSEAAPEGATPSERPAASSALPAEAPETSPTRSTAALADQAPEEPSAAGPVEESAQEAAGEDIEHSFDWDHAEAQIGDETPPPFIERTMGEDGEPTVAIDPALPRVSFEDVGGLDNVKARLNESFIQPMRHAEIAKAFKKTLRGGLLLYGPPGCGKTFMGRAVAGELEADFMSVSITDIVSGIHGQTEQNIHGIFEEARANENPTVLFLDEIDAVAMKRSAMSGSSVWLRSGVNQLLLEMDSMSGNNDGLYVLAATNHPWDLDEAILRPGRLDRAVLVSPPDAAAREYILQRQLDARPVAGIDLDLLVEGSRDFSGADLQHLVVTASEKAMMLSIQAGEVLPITMENLATAMGEVRPSTAEWFASARNVVRFAADGGRYDDLRAYLTAHDGDMKQERRKGWWS